MHRVVVCIGIGMIAGSLIFGHMPSACAEFLGIQSAEEKREELLHDAEKRKEERDELVEDGKFEEARKLLWDSQQGQRKEKTLRMADVEIDADGKQTEQWREFHVSDTESVTDYDTTQRVRRSGDHALQCTAGASGAQPTAAMELVRDDKRLGKRSLRIDYDTAGDGTVEYRYSFKSKARFEQFLKDARVLSVRLKGDPSFVTIAVAVRDTSYVYEFTGLKQDVWQDVAVPVTVFKGLAADNVRNITAIVLRVDGNTLEKPSGQLFVDDVLFAKVDDDVLRDLAHVCENDRYKDPAAFIGQYYEKREKY